MTEEDNRIKIRPLDPIDLSKYSDDELNEHFNLNMDNCRIFVKKMTKQEFEATYPGKRHSFECS